jgi:hypothetical protein
LVLPALAGASVWVTGADSRCGSRWASVGWRLGTGADLAVLPLGCSAGLQVFTDCAADDFGDAEVFLGGAQQQGTLEFGVESY